MGTHFSSTLSHMCTLIHFCTSQLPYEQQQKKNQTCETTRGIKTDKMDKSVANVCVEFCSGGQQTVLQP